MTISIFECAWIFEGKKAIEWATIFSSFIWHKPFCWHFWGMTLCGLEGRSSRICWGLMRCWWVSCWCRWRFSARCSRWPTTIDFWQSLETFRPYRWAFGRRWAMVLACATECCCGMATTSRGCCRWAWKIWSKVDFWKSSVALVWLLIHPCWRCSVDGDQWLVTRPRVTLLCWPDLSWSNKTNASL